MYGRFCFGNFIADYLAGEVASRHFDVNWKCATRESSRQQHENNFVPTSYLSKIRFFPIQQMCSLEQFLWWANILWHSLRISHMRQWSWPYADQHKMHYMNSKNICAADVKRISPFQTFGWGIKATNYTNRCNKLVFCANLQWKHS